MLAAHFTWTPETTLFLGVVEGVVERGESKIKNPRVNLRRRRNAY